MIAGEYQQRPFCCSVVQAGTVRETSLCMVQAFQSRAELQEICVYACGFVPEEGTNRCHRVASASLCAVLQPLTMLVDGAGDLCVCIWLHAGEGHQVSATGGGPRDVEAAVQRAPLAAAGVLVCSSPRHSAPVSTFCSERNAACVLMKAAVQCAPLAAAGILVQPPCQDAWQCPCPDSDSAERDIWGRAQPCSGAVCNYAHKEGCD